MAEEIGRRVAHELSDNFAKMGSDILAQQSKLSLAMETFLSLRRAINIELRGFNQVIQPEFRLTMLPGQNCLIFSFDTRLALTLKVEIGIVRLVPPPPNNVPAVSRNSPAATLDFVVTRDNAEFTFQQISIPESPKRPLSQAQFIEGVIRVACSEPFEH